jgi:hypothetical protein
MSLVISKVFTYDTDAGDYIQRVEGASGDNQALEPATRQAINNFVIGCKQDGIWNAIKASCILSGARTLAGALQPLAGTAPTNVGGLFVSGDYNRKTGLVGNGSSKYLNANRAGNTDPQNSFHQAVYASTAATSGPGKFPIYIGTSGPAERNIVRDQNNGSLFATFNSSTNGTSSAAPGNSIGLLGHRRSGSSAGLFRAGSIDYTITLASTAPLSDNIGIFATTGANLSITYSNGRLAFYSIGESLDLALLDARVTALITAFGVAIP